VDFTRVSADERVQVEVAVELRGEAPGTKENGVVTQVVHEVTVECLATNVPENIVVNINHLELEQQITVADLELPDGVKLELEPETVIVQCMPAIEEPEEDELGATSEPEVIGKADSDEDSDSE
jgi:large subunit ribosomal protein L25